MRAQVVESFRRSGRFDLAALHLITPIRIAACVMVFLLIGQVTHHLSLGVAAAMGAFICGVADTGTTYPIRARVMTVAAVSLGVAALVGTLVSGSSLVIILVSMPVAALCGFAGVFGPNASLTGMLALVIFDIYAGAPVSLGFGVQEAFAVAVGGLVQTAVALSGWPTKRLAGMRGVTADVWRAYAVLLAGDPRFLLNPQLPGKLLSAAALVEPSGVVGESRDWIERLISSAQQIRLPMTSLAARRVDLRIRGDGAAELAALDDFSKQVARFSRAVSRGLVLPFRRTAIPARLAEVEAASQRARQFAPLQVDTVVNALTVVARDLTGPLPIGRRGQLEFRFRTDDHRLSLLPTLREELKSSSVVARHALRLAAVTGVAWIVGLLVLEGHHYWVALTVAWVTRPGYGLTIGRGIARIGGTLVGLVLIGAVILVFDPHVAGLMVISALAAYVLYALLPVNYGFAVVFITVLILALLALSGVSLAESFQDRALGTVIGGVLSLIACQIGVSWASPMLLQHLQELVVETRVYVKASLAGKSEDPTVALPMIKARSQCQTAIEDALLEPQRGPLSPRRALHVFNAIVTGMFMVVVADAKSRTAFRAEVDAELIDQDLAELQRRMRSIADGEGKVTAIEPGLAPNQSDTGGHPAHVAFRRALSYLT